MALHCIYKNQTFEIFQSRKKSFSYVVACIWNKLPDFLKTTVNERQYIQTHKICCFEK